MSDEIKDAVKRQFGMNAANYVGSSIHAQGGDLSLLPQIAGLDGTQEVLDVATATGHTALALSLHARRVVGVDLVPEMLDQARAQAASRGISNVTFVEGDAERLPFPDESFHVVTCRIAAHHFPTVELFCREAARVLRPGGTLIVVDNVVPEEPELDRFINAVEKLRDPSHFRAWRLSEWEGFVTDAGLSFAVVHQFTSSVDREKWLARMSVPESVADQVRKALTEATDGARETFRITADRFILFKAIMIGRKPA